MRRVVLVLMTSIVLLLGTPALAQTRAQAEARADTQSGPATRGGSLEAEVAALKRIVAEHERRIAALEAALAKLAPAAADATEGSSEDAGQPMIAPATPAESDASAVAQAPARDQAQAQDRADLPPWAREESWRKIRIGMTEDEVLKLLGPPDSSREIGFTRRLIYKGEVPGRGFLKGVVKLTGGAVSDLDLPDF